MLSKDQARVIEDMAHFIEKDSLKMRVAELEADNLETTRLLIRAWCLLHDAGIADRSTEANDWRKRNRAALEES